MTTDSLARAPMLPQALLRLLPVPAQFKPVAQRIPRFVHERLLEQALRRALATTDLGETLDLVEDRRLGIEVEDLGLHWVFQWRGGRLRALHEPAEATVRGDSVDLLQLVSRLEDADTLFFQRRLTLLGDTELGLTVRNLLDRVPWEAFPSTLRVALEHGAILATQVRDAHRR